MVSIAIIEDNNSLGMRLREHIESEKYTVSVYNSAEEAMENITCDNLPDIVLMDISLPQMSGTECTRLLKSNYPAIEIIMYSISDSMENINKSIEAGASGYILKEDVVDLAEIDKAVNTVLNGESYLSGKITRKLISDTKNKHNRVMKIDPAYGLTQREEEILGCFVREGFSDQQISAKYGISTKTVNHHLDSVHKKMGVKSRREIIAKILKDNNWPQ